MMKYLFITINSLETYSSCRRSMLTKTVQTSVFDDGKVYTSCAQEFGFAGLRYISSTVKNRELFEIFNF